MDYKYRKEAEMEISLTEENLKGIWQRIFKRFKILAHVLRGGT